MLSKRLEKIASLVDSNEVVDIGCDHALLDIYLTQKGYTCTAIDNKESVLKLTKENIKKYNLSDKIKVILSDGLNNYNLKGNECVIIAGMGTNTILKIVKKNINTLIIQSNNDLYKLRKNICKKGYYIDKEIALYDKKYYNIIRFKKGHKKYKYYNYYFGLYIDNDYKNYLYNKLNKTYNKIPYKNIIKKIKYKILLIKLKHYKTSK